MDLQPAETTLYSLSETAPDAPVERRDDNRLTSLYRVGSLTIGDRRELCLIKNISAGGMMIRCYCRIAEGTRLSVELKCGQPITGTVSWTRDDQVGIKFDGPIDVIELLGNGTAGTRPRTPRIEVSRLVTLREGATIHRLRLCDISQGGLKVQCEAGLAPGADVIVTLAGIEPLPGVVRWATHGHAGITLNRLLALPTLVDWLRDTTATPTS